jgi:hypothetical protein
VEVLSEPQVEEVPGGLQHFQAGGNVSKLFVFIADFAAKSPSVKKSQPRKEPFTQMIMLS